MEGTISLDTAIGEGGLGHSAGQAGAGHLLAAPLLRPPSTPSFRSFPPALCTETCAPLAALRPAGSWPWAQRPDQDLAKHSVHREPWSVSAGEAGDLMCISGRGCGTTWQRGPGWDPTEGKERRNSRGTEEGLARCTAPTVSPRACPSPFCILRPLSDPSNLSFMCPIGGGAIFSFSPASSQPGQPPSMSRLPLHASPQSGLRPPLLPTSRNPRVLHHSSHLPDPSAQDSFQVVSPASGPSGRGPHTHSSLNHSGAPRLLGG